MFEVYIICILIFIVLTVFITFSYIFKNEKEALNSLPIENLFKVNELKEDFSNKFNIIVKDNALLIEDIHQNFLLDFSLKSSKKMSNMLLKWQREHFVEMAVN